MPVATNELCLRAGRVMKYGDGIYGGMFASCIYSAAFFEHDPRKVGEAGVACLPPQSPYALLINDVLAWSDEHPGDWVKSWELIGENVERIAVVASTPLLEDGGRMVVRAGATV